MNSTGNSLTVNNFTETDFSFRIAESISLLKSQKGHIDDKVEQILKKFEWQIMTKSNFRFGNSWLFSRMAQNGNKNWKYFSVIGNAQSLVQQSLEK